MKNRRTTRISATQTENKPCEFAGCISTGEYRAPKSPDQLGDYQWLCLEHIREFNKKWDYFDGMNATEIEEFMKEAVTGHRPTWRREEHFTFSTDRLMEELDRFLGNRPKNQRRQRSDDADAGLPARERKALRALDLKWPLTIGELKTRYKQLAKQCHPDLHPGDTDAEERFKNITVAYMFLSARLKESHEIRD